MGREVRRVPPDWQHPRQEDNASRFVPLYGRSYTDEAAEFLAMANEKGLQKAVDWFGRAPDKNDYMPEWTPEQATHFMMYEDTSEGTPISPAFATPEELARWLADTNASAFGRETATYEQWLATINRGFAVSMVFDPERGLRSGVAS